MNKQADRLIMMRVNVLMEVNMKIVNKILIIVCILAVLTACHKSKDEEIEEVQQAEELAVKIEKTKTLTPGEIINETYTNDYLGLNIDIPKTWTVATKEELEMVLNTGEAILNEEEVVLAETEIVTLFGVFKYPLKEQVLMNPSIIMNAEKLDPNIGLITGEDYLLASRDVLSETKLPYEFGDSIEEVELAGKIFDKMTARIVTESLTVNQLYYATVIEGYAINIIATYTEDEGKDEILSVLE